MNKVESSRIVLQGEFEVKKSSDKDEFIKTSKPSTCNVLVLHDSTKKISALAHIDDYVSVLSVIHKIQEVLKEEHQVSLGFNFKATILGGNQSNTESMKQQAQLVRILTSFEIAISKNPLTMKPERPQIGLNARNGEIVFYEGSQLNLRMEYLQQREYGNFNDYLDEYFGDLTGDQIPYFEASRAFRTESDIPEFRVDPVNHFAATRALENTKIFKLPYKKASKPIPTKEQALTVLGRLLADIYPTVASFHQSLKDKNVNLLLRQASAEQSYIHVIDFLLRNRTALEVDTRARGATSGTALDVAKKKDNQEAIKALEYL